MDTLDNQPTELQPDFAGTHLRYFMELAYKGTDYHGWQIQPNGISIQERLNEALSKLLHEPIYCIGCGRTDAGVHARQFFAHFDAANPIADNTVFRLNRFLGADFAIRRIIKVHENAHARFDATERTYEYHMHFGEDPFRQGLSYLLFELPNVALMNEAAKILLQYQDFKSLCKTGGGSKTTLCTLYKAHFDWDEATGTLVFTISANRFLRNMVRMTTAMLLMIGKGKMTIDEMKQVIETQGVFDRLTAVPACGLYLTSVKYPYI